MSSKVLSLVVSASGSEPPGRFPRMRRVLPAVSFLALSACGGMADDPSAVTVGEALKGGHHHPPSGEELVWREPSLPFPPVDEPFDRASSAGTQPWSCSWNGDAG